MVFSIPTILKYTRLSALNPHDHAYDLYDLLEEDALTRLRDADCMSASDTDDDAN